MTIKIAPDITSIFPTTFLPLDRDELSVISNAHLDALTGLQNMHASLVERYKRLKDPSPAVTFCNLTLIHHIEQQIAYCETVKLWCLDPNVMDRIGKPRHEH